MYVALTEALAAVLITGDRHLLRTPGLHIRVQVLFNSRPLGTIPIVTPLAPDMTIIFSGRRWRVRAVHEREKVIEVTRDATGRPPPFGGGAGVIDDAVIRRMRKTLQEGGYIPRYLDPEAAALLREGRDAYRRMDLSHSRIVDLGSNHHLVATWEGSIRTATLALALRLQGFEVTVHDGFLDVSAMDDNADLTGTLASLARQGAPNGNELAAGIASVESEKFHRYLSRDLLIADAVAGKIAPDAVPAMAKAILEGA